MVRCMPWYCWTMLRRWLIGGVRFFQSFWEGVEVDFTFFFWLGKMTASVRGCQEEQTSFGKPISVALSIFFLWVNFNRMLDKGFFTLRWRNIFRMLGERRINIKFTAALVKVSQQTSSKLGTLRLCGLWFVWLRSGRDH